MAKSMLLKLSNLKSEVTLAELMGELVPPSEFSKVSFKSYIPDASHPSQAIALQKAEIFTVGLSKRNAGSKGIYLDGGFGVGKTHLLSSIYQSANVSKIYGPFIAYTSIIGYLGFATALVEFSKYRLICIDEFELDDPGDTMLISRLLKELSNAGVSFAATSNTPPNALGAGRFAAESFQREIHSVADKFEMVRIDGEDYRHRRANYEFVACTEENLQSIANSSNRVLICSLGQLLDYLASIHQSRYAKVAEQFDVLLLSDIEQIDDQFEGLRFVSFIDRCYEAGIGLAFSGKDPSVIFRPDHIQGGYQKKYLRCNSRLYAMNSRLSMVA